MDGDDLLHVDDAALADETVAAFVSDGALAVFGPHVIHLPPTRPHAVMRLLEKGRAANGTIARAALRALERPGLATSVLKALCAGALGEAKALARMAGIPRDIRYGDKIVSHRYRFLWVGVPRAATRSLLAALLPLDPGARFVHGNSVAELYSQWPRVEGYFSFAFVRHPFNRALSFHRHMLRANRGGHMEKVLWLYPGLAAAKGFDGYSEWLNGPFGADAFADRHFRSQHLTIRVGRGRLPDFVGRFEDLPAGLAAVAERLGMPTPHLPMLNTANGWTTTPEALSSTRTEMRTQLTARSKALLKKRYATDFQLFGYS